ncbi:MAG: energy-coupling factor transporter ATPase [Lachnospiraceae bacterium]|nr:energy-coupling factor transporter ATPase [Lachnospiraceae bacterium]MBP5249591.1 energy-coupling factor transporter ATPase [Lachnospiraceae bacterium]
MLYLDKVSYTYSPGTAMEMPALHEISLEIPDGQFIGIIGHTGSGKSTLIQHLNGLVKPTGGVIYYNGRDIWDEDFSRKELRTKVGLVFQYPEHQLFETTVVKDVEFGPRNMKLDNLEVQLRTFEALKTVGISDELYDASPFDLSGGQKRRVAIAGVLAMKPEVLVLDEPTAGLDPAGRDEILEAIFRIKRERNITVILVSHSMEDVARFVDRIIVMEHGSVKYDGSPKEVFRNYKELEEIGLAAPDVTYLTAMLRERGVGLPDVATTVEEAADMIERYCKH